MTQSDPQNHMHIYKFQSLKILDGGWHHFEKWLITKLNNSSIDVHAIWRDDALWPTLPC